MPSKIKLLLIEDNPADVGLITIFLDEVFSDNYSLGKAEYLSEGLKRLRQHQFDAVLCDLALPDSYGMDTFEQVLNASQGVPIILLTGYGDETFGTNAVARGAADFLNKNQLDGNLLRRAILYSIERSNLNKQLLLYTKNLEESEKKYRTLFEESKDPIYISTYGGRLLDFNNATAELFGYTKEEMAKLSLSDLYYYPEEKNNFKESLKKKGSIKDYEVILQKKDGTPVICCISAAPHKDDKGELQYRGIIKDITVQKKIEELRRAKDLAEQTALARQEFLSVMSHEIRTPLNTIFFTTHLLQDGEPSPKQKEHLNILQFSANNLLALVNNILDFSKIESGKVKLEKINFNFRDLIHRILDSFAHNAEKNNLKLNVSLENNLPEILIGDPTRLTQILNNLLHNAIKFTLKGEVTLHIETLSKKDNEVDLLFEVSDTGIGIENDRLEEIFESFTQANPSVTRQFGGTGLGLTICKKLIKIMGGDIKVESQIGKGSSFYFNIPFQIGSADKINTPGIGESDYSLKEARILLVEDNLTNQMLAAQFLSRWGAFVDTAENGQMAIEKLKEKKFDLVLMDIQMPVMDGYQAIKQIRQMGFAKSELPVIALTAYAMDEDRAKALESGMNDYISKPIDPYELYSKVIKNINYKLAIDDDPFQNKNNEKEEVINLASLIESFKDDPAFVSDYLKTYEKEFKELPVEAVKLATQRDVKSLTNLIHKMNPSIRRFEDTNLLSQLNKLKELISNNNSSEIEIEQIEKSIQESCEHLLESIYTLKLDYV